jgi:hypothetical protein
MVMCLVTRHATSDGDGWWFHLGVYSTIAAHCFATALVIYLNNQNGEFEVTGRSPKLEASIALSSIVPVAIAALVCGVVTRWRHRTVFGMFPRAQAVQFVAVPHPIKAFRSDPTRLMCLLIGGLSALCAFWAWIDLFSNAGSRWPAGALLLTLLPLVVWLARWRWGLPERLPGEVTVEELAEGKLSRVERLSPRRAAMWGLVWYRQSLGGFVVIVSLVYLAMMLGSLPSRRAADARLNMTIQHGEMALALGKVK